MTMIFDGLHTETYRVAIGLPVAKRNADCSEFPSLECKPMRTRRVWIAAAWGSFSEVLGEPEYLFPSDYWLGP